METPIPTINEGAQFAAKQVKHSVTWCVDGTTTIVVYASKCGLGYTFNDQWEYSATYKETCARD